MSFAHWPQQGQQCVQSGGDVSAFGFWPVNDLLEESGAWHVEPLRRRPRQPTRQRRWQGPVRLARCKEAGGTAAVQTERDMWHARVRGRGGCWQAVCRGSCSEQPVLRGKGGYSEKCYGAAGIV